MVEDRWADVFDMTQFCIAGNEIHCFWTDADYNLRYSHSGDKGETWDPSIVLFDWPPHWWWEFSVGANHCGYTSGILWYQFEDWDADESRMVISTDGENWQNILIFEYPEVDGWVEFVSAAYSYVS